MPKLFFVNLAVNKTQICLSEHLQLSFLLFWVTTINAFVKVFCRKTYLRNKRNMWIYTRWV